MLGWFILFLPVEPPRSISHPLLWSILHFLMRSLSGGDISIFGAPRLGNLSEPSPDFPAGKQECGHIPSHQTMFCGVQICSPAWTQLLWATCSHRALVGTSQPPHPLDQPSAHIKISTAQRLVSGCSFNILFSPLFSGAYVIFFCL